MPRLWLNRTHQQAVRPILLLQGQHIPPNLTQRVVTQRNLTQLVVAIQRNLTQLVVAIQRSHTQALHQADMISREVFTFNQCPFNQCMFNQCICKPHQ
jgi:hypothetical protein